MERDAAVDAVFKPVRPPTTFEETVERLGTAIRLGLLVPGTKLPPERTLADELAISRSTLRQALTTLTQSGHLVSLRGRSGGTFVADEPPLAEAAASESSDALSAEAWAILDYRVAIETGSATLAAERADRDGLSRLDELVTRMSQRRRLRGLPVDRRPLPHRHRRGRRLSAPRLRDDRGPGPDERPDRPDPAPRTGPHPLNEQHAGIVKLLRLGDGPGSARLMREHIEGTEHILAGLLPRGA